LRDTVKEHQLLSGFLGAVVGALIIAAATLLATSGGSSHESPTTTPSSRTAPASSHPIDEGATTTSSSGNTAGTSSSPEAHEANEIPQLASSYKGTGRNTMLNASGRLTLTNVTESSNGAIAGQVIWSDGLRGSGPFAGTVKGGNISFTSSIASPQECEDRCTSITYAGTLSANGTLAGTYVAYQTSGEAQRGTWELAPSTPE
jgi:hypothetical protein